MFWKNKNGVKVKVDQSGAKIGIGHVNNLNCQQIAANINYGVSPEPQVSTNNGNGSGQSIAIGVLSWEDLDDLCDSEGDEI